MMCERESVGRERVVRVVWWEEEIEGGVEWRGMEELLKTRTKRWSQRKCELFDSDNHAAT